MGDPRGPEHGWSRVLPTTRGWYEIAPDRRIDASEPNVTRVWTDGSGGFWSPTMVEAHELKQMRVPRRSWMPLAGGQAIVFLQVYGSFKNTLFRALGPLLHPSLHETETIPQLVKFYQDFETYMTAAQQREAKAIKEARPHDDK